MVRGNGEGSNEAAIKAQGLAAFADAEFIEAILHVKATLDRLGGQTTIGAYREKFNAAGDRVEPDEVGTYETLGYVFRYEPHNKLSHGPDEPDAKQSDPPPPLGFTDVPLDEEESDADAAVPAPVE